MSTININLSANTIYSGDGTLAGNRTVDANGYQLQISNAGVFIVDGSFAPSGGNGTFTLNGYGTTSTDRVEKITSDSGVVRESFGDKSVQHYGSNGFNTIPNGNGWIMVDSAGAGVAGIHVGGTNVVGVRADVSNASCFVGNGQIGVNVNGSLYGVYTSSSAGKSIYSQGDNYMETFGLGGTPETSAVLHVNSTTQGALLPKMTTTQRDAISSPAVGLEIYNTTLGRKEVYNGSYWASLTPQSVNITSGSVNMTAGSNFFFGNMAIFPTTTASNRQFKSPVSGIIRKAFIRSFAGTVAGDRPMSVYIRINSTDYLVATVSASVANREFVNTSLNIPIVANTDNIVMYAVASGGTTDSTGVFFGGQLIVE